ncbi:O-methyltransferase [Xylariaceae sp. FL1651]|nr:O-methyltransferase [Xylariaceae sp. FL1651]
MDTHENVSTATVSDQPEQVALLDLASNILKQTQGLTAYLQTHQLQEPNFNWNSPDIPETPEYMDIQSKLSASLDDLRRLVDGPRRFARSFICQGNDLAAFQIAFEFNLFEIVPLKGSINVAELAKLAGLDVDRTSRVMRMLVTHRVFRENPEDLFSHTAVSAVFNREEGMRCAGAYILDEMWTAAASAAISAKSSPYESDYNSCPFKTSHGVPLFKYYDMNPQLATRFAKAMAAVTTCEYLIPDLDRQIAELRDYFPWNSLKGTVVDVGGGSGHVSIALARNFPNLNFVVQDISTRMLDVGKSIITDDIADRISFMQHDFFEPQPVKDVSAIFIRQCLHNWCDRDVVKILRALVPALESSAAATSILINDTVLPAPGTMPLHEERGLRQMDMLMLVALGSKQRTCNEIQSLLTEADSRYRIHKVHSEGSMGLIEIQLERML